MGVFLPISRSLSGSDRRQSQDALCGVHGIGDYSITAFSAVAVMVEHFFRRRFMTAVLAFKRRWRTYWWHIEFHHDSNLANMRASVMDSGVCLFHVLDPNVRTAA